MACVYYREESPDITVSISTVPGLTWFFLKEIVRIPPFNFVFIRKKHSYIASENLLMRFGKGNLPCLHFDLKALAMPSF